MTQRVVFLNGPPGSGKDTIGLAMLRRYDFVRLYEMKMPMDRALRAFFDMDATSWQAWEQNKNVQLSAVNGIPFDTTQSLRDIKIAFSEMFAKVVFGREVFGHLAVERMKRSTAPTLTIITDSGFFQEAEPIIHHIGIRNCMLIHLYRPEHTFINDSRGYWNMLGLYTIDAHNNIELPMFIDLVDHVVMKWMNAPRV
jgi:hypothetical protein